MVDFKNALQPDPRFSENKRPVSNDLATLSDELIKTLVPPRVSEMVQDPSHLKYIIDKGQKRGNAFIQIVVLEKDYPEELTHPQAYSEWRANKNNVSQVTNSTGPINRLHKDLYKFIDKGQVSITDRVLFVAELSQRSDAPASLYVNNFDGESNQGIGTQFYTEVLPHLALELGFRFIIGMNGPLNIDFFKKMGRSTANEILQAKFSEIFGSIDPEGVGEFLTVQFLYPEDKEKYLANEVG